MITSIVSLAAAALLLGQASPPPAKPASAPKGAVSDRDLGLSRTSVFDVPEPAAYHPEDSTPGEKPLPKRISTEIPPVVPHGIADFMPITRADNACLACHEVAGPKKKGEATPIPGSHYVDLRRDPARKGEHVSGARWVCVSCHVPRSDAKPLVGSNFRP